MLTLSFLRAPSPAGTADAGCSANRTSRLTRVRRAIAPWAASALVLSLAACGGGGGGGGSFPVSLGSSSTSKPTDPSTDTPVTPTHKVTGSVTGLAGSGLVLQNGSDTLAVSANGSITVALALPEGLAYNVSVKTQPTSPTQLCTVNGGSGTVAKDDIVNVAVVCSTSSFNVSGSVSGLEGGGLVLQNNAGDDIEVAASGLVDFGNVASGAQYAVTVKSQPTNPVQTCSVTKGTGSVNDVAISDVSVVCDTNSYTVGGTVAGLDGTGLKLQNNDGDEITVDANGGFTFPAKVASNSAYTVKVSAQPTDKSQTCSVENATGTIVGSAISNVLVKCDVNSFKVKGTVSGLDGVGLKLLNSGADDLTITGNGQFSFKTAVASGTGYEVTVGTQPSLVTQNCVVTDGKSTIGGTNVVNVVVDCTSPTARYAYLTSALGKVQAYDFQANRLLSAAPVSSANTEAGPLWIGVDPTGTHGYVGTLAGINQYSIGDLTGAVGAMAPAKVTAGTVPTGLALDPKNRFAYVLNTFDGLVSGKGQVSVLSVNATSGALAPASTVSTGLLPLALAADPLGHYVYVGNFGSLLKLTPRITAYKVDADNNKLTEVASAATFGNAGVASMAADPSGRFVYALTGNISIGSIRSVNDLAGIASTTIEGFKIQSNGSLMTSGAQALGGTAMATSITVDPSGHFVYVALSNGAVRLYTIDTTSIGNPGTLTAGADTTALNSPIVRVTIDPSGKTLYAATATDVVAYSIDRTTGALTKIGTTHTPAQTTVFTSMALGL